MSKNIYDISPLISKEIAVFPGDIAFTQNKSMMLSEGHNIDLSSIEATLHLGAHADAPSHYSSGAATIEAADLELYMGGCQILTASGVKDLRVYPEHLNIKAIKEKRILIRTSSYPDPNRWTDDFYGLSPELIIELNNQGVKLIGIDTPSVDPAKSKKLEAHQKIAKLNMRILEGLVLSEEVIDVKTYELIALPLKIAGAEASPVRAILRG